MALPLVGHAVPVSAGARVQANRTTRDMAIEARGWVQVEVSGDATVFYQSPIVRPEGELPRVWVRIERTTPDAAYPHFLSKQSLLEYNCDAGTFRVIQSTLFAGARQTGAASIGVRDPWGPVKPGTVPAVVQKLVCGAR